MTDDQAKRRELREKVIFLVKAAYEQGVFVSDEIAYEETDESLQAHKLPIGQVVTELMQLFDIYLATERAIWEKERDDRSKE